MRVETIVQRHRAALFAVAVIAPLVVCAGLAVVRESIATATVALVLVLVVVAAAATGVRLAGFVAALSSGLWFDFFLTEPYVLARITGRSVIDAAVLPNRALAAV